MHKQWGEGLLLLKELPDETTRCDENAMQSVTDIVGGASVPAVH